MKKSVATKLSILLCFSCLFLFFASLSMAAQSAAQARNPLSKLTVNASTMAKVQKNADVSRIKTDKKTEILAKALRIPLGQEFKAFFTLEPPHGIEAVREELQSKTIYRAVFGVNIPL